ncbi:MAG: insulinase family protein [Lachnospiraceae bacterium]|nr:insulinase family protein [Lachnospiraceae bacterium]
MNLEVLSQYELLQQERIEDIRSDGYLLRHKKSGARILVLQNEDENKVFNIAFKTLPTDSTGVPHILEHSVLCGSRKFPMKDPFVELVKGSLNTFLNAMTYPDKTMYPIASCNDKDFCNLMDVYLDAVFYPNIYRNEQIFRQEGWSYLIEKPEDELTINGVVYNEMKGAFSSPEDMLERTIMDSLFPDTVYGVESGGDPEHIPELKYEDFLAFHKKYYHPSNSYIYFYGNMDIEERLTWLDQEYLSAFERSDEKTVIGLQAPFEEMHIVKRSYPVSAMDEAFCEGLAEEGEDSLKDSTYLAWSAVIGTGTQVELSNAFDVLEYALLSAPGARLKQALLDAGIGNDIMGDYEGGVYQPYLTIIAKNANEKDSERFLSVIRKTLEQIVEEGVDKKALYAGINSMEFKFREADYGTAPKGLIYGMDVFDSWLYDEDAPFDYLKQLDVYAALRERVETSYFEDLIRNWLLDNTHTSLVELIPERGLTAKTDAALRKKLRAYKESLDAAQIDELIAATGRLRAFQETPSTLEELSRLPMLTRADIGKQAASFENEPYDWDGITVLHHDVFTNGIAYLDLLFDAGQVPVEDLGYLGILKAVLGMVDTEHFSYSDLNNDINMNTGGISAGVSVFPLPSEGQEQGDCGRSGIRSFAGIRSRVLYGKLPYALKMSEEILSSRFDDDKRLYEILAKLESRLSMQLASAGHQAAVGRALSYLTEFGAFNDAVSGIAFYELVANLEKQFDEKKETLKEKLRSLVALLFREENLFVSVTCDKEGLEALRAPLEAFRKELGQNVDCPARMESEPEADGSCPAKAAKAPGTDGIHSDQAAKTPEADGSCPVQAAEDLAPRVRAFVPDKKNEGFTTPGQVQYVARAGNFRRAGLPYTGALKILKVLMSYEYLWVNIRVKGGAYGCMCSFGRMGDSYLVSYRDPHLRGTNEVFEGIPEYLKGFDTDEREMTKYIIGTISDLDTPLTPMMKGSRSLNAYFGQITEEDVQRERDEILAATPEQIRALAPIVQAVLDDQAFCVVGNEEKIKEAEDLFGSVKPLTGSRTA